MAEASAGRLEPASNSRSSRLADVPAHELATELLARLADGEPLHVRDTAAEIHGALSMRLERVGDLPHNRYARARIAQTFGHNERFWRGHGDPIRDATIVELGCGSLHPLANLLVYVLLGARRGIGVDLDPPTAPELSCHAMARLCGYLLTEPRLVVGDLDVDRRAIADALDGFDLARLWAGDPAGIDSRRLTLLQESATNLSIDTASVDFAFSISFFEHLPDPDAAIRELARITRPGGLGHHAIDGLDHRHYGQPDLHPLAFLEEEPDATLVGGCNRIRPLEYPAFFERHGFEVLEVGGRVETAFDEARRERLVGRFRELPAATLRTGQASVFVRRLPNG
jgi:SAM-dependent methyltransferase